MQPLTAARAHFSLLADNCCNQSSDSAGSERTERRSPRGIDQVLALNVNNKQADARLLPASVYLLNCQLWDGQSIQAQREAFQSQFKLWFNRVIYTMYSEPLVCHHSADLQAIFHFRTTAGLRGPAVGFVRVISGVWHFSSSREETHDWPMLQQSNEASPTHSLVLLHIQLSLRSPQ